MKRSRSFQGVGGIFVMGILWASGFVMLQSLGSIDCWAGGPEAGPPPASALYPTDDAYVSYAWDANTNFGTAGSLWISYTGPSNQSSYLKFDLSGLPSNGVVTKATLWLQRYGSMDMGFQVAVRTLADDDWDEETITFNNSPYKGSWYIDPFGGSLIDEILVSAGDGGWFTWDVASWAQESYQTDRLMSLFVTYDPRPPYPVSIAAFFSKEAGSGSSPRLEVEIEYPDDLGDAPDPPYPTLRANNGAWHTIKDGFYLGSGVDGEPDGQPDPDALGDDSAGTDDEDGVVFTSVLTPGLTASADVTVVNTWRVPAWLCAWIDFNGDGTWAGETIFSGAVSPGVNKLTFGVPATAVPGQTYARFRLMPVGPILYEQYYEGGIVSAAYNNYGEVEDYKVTIESPYTLDFGDAPAHYPTLLADDGARHTLVPGVYLGNRVDGEPDGQPDLSALGDDQAQLSYFDDEDGVVFTSALVCTQTACIDVSASCAGYLSGWVDFNGDGDWSDPGEGIFLNRSLSSGPNRLTFTVPAGASIGLTCARFRFSGSMIPGYTGLCVDGEVEDYQVRILGHEAPKAPVDRLIQSQPPLEADPINGPGQYCGPAWPSYGPDGSGYVNVAADDFVSLGGMPVTSVHWWGSYQGWSDRNPPSVRPVRFQIGFWSNVRAGTNWHSRHPGTLLRLVEIPIARVQEQWVGFSEIQYPHPAESCFQYYVEFDPAEYFWQGVFYGSTTDETFWISIVAIYPSGQASAAAWEWQTRPCLAADAGVRFRVPGLSTGLVVDPTAHSLDRLQEVESMGAWIRPFDLAFELDTETTYVKWAQPFTSIRDWPHYEDQVSMATVGVTETTQGPDLTGTGVDVDASSLVPPMTSYSDEIVADDFSSTGAGTLTGITIWGSWEGDNLPRDHPSDMDLNVTVREDDARAPGQVLWSQRFRKDAFTVETLDSLPEGFYDPAGNTYAAANHTKVYKYTLRVDPANALVLSGTLASPKVYWLCVQAEVVLAPGSMGVERFGWKTSTDHNGGRARWAAATEPYDGVWNDLGYPAGHPNAFKPVDMAFSLSMQSSGGGGPLVIQGLVADDWEYRPPAIGVATGVTGVVWWGSYIGYGSGHCSTPGSLLTLPPRPDSFLLSLWSDQPVLRLNDLHVQDFSHPRGKIWEYEAADYEQTLVGVDKHPYGEPNEAVFRYSMRLPWDKAIQPAAQGIYWFSVMAVYKNASSVVYPWGWANHAHVYNDDAVTGKPLTSPAGTWDWQPLKDQTGSTEDMSFMLFADPLP